jgi:voltage-gated potassium channel
MEAPAGEPAEGRGTWRSRVYPLLDGEGRTPGSAAVRVIMVAAIVLNATAIVLATVKSLATIYGGLFGTIDKLALVLFALDYAARIWAAPEDKTVAAGGPWSARLTYLLSPLGIIDLVALLPLCLGLFVRAGSDWLHVLRLFAVLKITRYAPALQIFVAVIRSESRVLMSALLGMTVNWVLVSAIIFALEHEAQPEVFSSMPQAMWWAIVTMATVGYGDIVPVSVAGRVFGGLVMVLGIASVAVPAGILATGFAAELRKRRSMISWQLVAKLPLFAHLEASRIAAIARLLKLDVVPPRYTIVLRGEPGDAMFFIVSGEVEVHVEPQPIRLGPGQYFGEIALLREVPRTATITSVTECELLVLSAADFRRLLQEYPAMKDSIRDVAERRVGEQQAAQRPG